MNTYEYSRQNRGRGSKNRSDFSTVLLFYVLPFIVINALLLFLVLTKPKCVITVPESNDFLSTTVTIKIKSFLPTKEPAATLDGTEVELQKQGRRTYTAVLSHNGILEVDLTALNRMSTATFEHINVLDDNPPTIADNGLSDDILSFTLSDTQSGVDYDSIYGLDINNLRVEPWSIDKNTSTISFQMTTDTLQVFAKDLSGNEVRATFKSDGGAEAETVAVGEADGEAAGNTPGNTAGNAAVGAGGDGAAASGAASQQ